MPRVSSSDLSVLQLGRECRDALAVEGATHYQRLVPKRRRHCSMTEFSSYLDVMMTKDYD